MIQKLGPAGRPWWLFQILTKMICVETQASYTVFHFEGSSLLMPQPLLLLGLPQSLLFWLHSKAALYHWTSTERQSTWSEPVKSAISFHDDQYLEVLTAQSAMFGWVKNNNGSAYKKSFIIYIYKLVNVNAFTKIEHQETLPFWKSTP